MKDQNKVFKKGKNQVRLSIIELTVGVFSYSIQNSFKAETTAPTKAALKANSTLLIHNKGNGPPGGWDSPGAGFISLPDYPVALCMGSHNIKSELIHIIHYQFSNLFHN